MVIEKNEASDKVLNLEWGFWTTWYLKGHSYEIFCETITLNYILGLH
jgi:hypothetical protein